MSLFSSNDEHFCTPFALNNQTNTRRGQIESTQLEPENEYGNVEYKLRLTDPTKERIERLVTQLKWRIREGHGEAILYLGVKDNGHFVGLTEEELALSLRTLEQMSSKIGAKMTIVKERVVKPESQDEANLENMMKTRGRGFRNKRTYKENMAQQHRGLATNGESSIGVGGGGGSSNTSTSVVGGSNSNSNTNNSGESGNSNSSNSNNNNNNSNNNETTLRSSRKSSSGKGQLKSQVRKVIQVLFKRKTHDISEELRVAVLGPTESGKSSLLGVLSHGEPDNGRGSARLNLFRHRHEVRSGHTSSISQEIFGFSCHGQPLTYNNCLTTEEIIESSSRIVTLIDLAGHQRYLSTTLFGLGSHSPDLVLVVMSALSTITNLTTDHVSLALGMEKSLAIVVNKVDLASLEHQNNCYEELIRAIHLTHPSLAPFRVASLNDAIVAGTKLGNPNFLPIFFTSCVTGSGLDGLYAFFNEISPKLNPSDLNHAVSQSSELQVDETFEVPGIGIVISGLITEGIIREGDEMLLGPDDEGCFSNVSVVTLQRHKIPCNFARAGQKCTMAIMADRANVRKGMVMKEMDLEWRHNFSVCLKFEARVKFIDNMKHRLSQGCPVSVYVGNVKQTCSVLTYENDQQNDSVSVLLKLTKRPEYIRLGSRIILRHSTTKAIGSVTRVQHLFQSDS